MSTVLLGAFGIRTFCDVIQQAEQVLPHHPGEVLCTNGNAFKWMQRPCRGWQEVNRKHRLTVVTPPPCAA